MTQRLATFEEVTNAQTAMGGFIKQMNGMTTDAAGVDEINDQLLRGAGLDPDGFAEFIQESAMDAMRQVVDMAIEAGGIPNAEDFMARIASNYIAGVVAGAKAVRAVYDEAAVNSA